MADFVEGPVEISTGVMYDVKTVSRKMWIITVDFYGMHYCETIEQDTILEKYMKINDVIGGVQKVIDDKRKSVLMIDDKSLIVRNISRDTIKKLRKY